jgi:hypothetical protein
MSTLAPVVLILHSGKGRRGTERRVSRSKPDQLGQKGVSDMRCEFGWQPNCTMRDVL